MSFVQQLIVGGFVYLFIGALIGVQFIISNDLLKATPQIKSTILYSWVVRWPINAMCWFGVQLLNKANDGRD